MGAKQTHISKQPDKPTQNRYSLDSPQIIPYSFKQLTQKKKSMYASLASPQGKPSSNEMDSTTRDLLFKVISEHFVLGRLDHQQIRELISEMQFSTAAAGEYIFHKGDEADALYIVNKGEVEVEFTDTTKNKRLQRGGIFGELAIVYQCTRLASIKVVQDAELWHINSKDLASMFKQVIDNRKKANKKYLISLELLKFVPEENRHALSQTFVEMIFDSTTVIYEQGQEAKRVYLLVQGMIEAVYDKKTTKIRPGCFFGDQQIYNIPNRICTVVTETRARVMSCSTEQLRKYLGRDPLSLCRVFCLRILLKRLRQGVDWLRELKQQQLDKILYEADIKLVQSGEKSAKDVKADNIYINFKCDVNAETDGYILNSLGNVPQLQSIEAGSLLARIDANAIDSAIQQNKDMTKLKLENIHLMRKIAEGSFSDVFLARNSRAVQPKDATLVVKCISKSLIGARQLAPSIHNEQTCLSQVDSPFIVKYYGSLKDKHTVYLIMEYIEGCQLFDLLKQSKALTNEASQFYLASLILCAEYLHSHRIIYRDFKPQNVVVKQDGYIKLVDLGAAKMLSVQDNFRTHTIIGTPAYMAPEVFSGSAYSFEADLWSIGVMFYEFLTGKLPFGQMSDDPMDISEEIMYMPVDIPANLQNNEAKDLIRQLLSKYPSDRIGKGKYCELKQHKYFVGFDWNGLQHCVLKSPFIPERKRKPSCFQDILNCFLQKVLPRQSCETPRSALQEVN